MISKEIIKQIVDEYKGDDIAEHLHLQLKLIEDIKSGISATNKCIHNEQTNHENKIKELKFTIKEWQKQCSHLSSTYYQHPSGNNDSFYECNICGKEF